MAESDYARNVNLRVKTTEITGPRFPVVDVHNHLSYVVPGEDVTDVDRLLAAMDAAGIRILVNLDGFWGAHLEAALKKYTEAHPDRFAVFGTIDYGEIDQPDFRAKITRSMAEMRRRGLRGIKVFKDLSLSYKDANGRLVYPSIPLFGNARTEHLRTYRPFGLDRPVMPDDDRLRPVWEQAANLRLPVLIHIADLTAFFQPPDEKNEQFDLLRIRPQWTYHGKGLPSFEMLLESQLKLLDKNPDTTFIFAHVGSYSEDLGWVSRMLAAYPNAHVDIAARIGELGRQPHTARKFFMDFPDRILFGTDRYPNPQEDYLPWKGISTIYRFLETFDEYFVPDIPRLCSWRLYGIGLPDHVLEKVYYRNAARLIPDLPKGGGGA